MFFISNNKVNATEINNNEVNINNFQNVDSLGYLYNFDGSPDYIYIDFMDKNGYVIFSEGTLENLYDYDNFGNYIHDNISSQIDQQNMFWERGNLLKEFNCDKNIKYFYNGEGLHFKKLIIDESIEYVYDGSK